MDLARLPLKIQDIAAARQRIGDAIYHSPCPRSLALSRLCGSQIYCKLDHLQMTGSFKERGARNRLMMLSPEQRKAGVIVASAGNHGLGISYHGRELGVPVTVVMPKWAPLVKVSNCRAFGAEIILHGESYDDARKQAAVLQSQRNLTYIPGFDDADIIAGQGTAGLEILEDVPDVDAVIVPIGGGGLIAGVGLVMKSLKPDVQVIGVEPYYAATMSESLRAGRVMRVETQPTLADGLAVAEPGTLCFDIVREVVDRIVLVDEGQIALSVLRLLELEKTVVEGAGATSLAAAMDPSLDLKGKKVVLLLSGGNIDVTLISRIIDRGLAADGRLCRLKVRTNDRPGTLARIAGLLATTGASIKEVSHDRHFGPADVARVLIEFILETRDSEHIQQVRAVLTQAGVDAAIE